MEQEEDPCSYWAWQTGFYDEMHFAEGHSSAWASVDPFAVASVGTGNCLQNSVTRFADLEQESSQAYWPSAVGSYPCSHTVGVWQQSAVVAAEASQSVAEEQVAPSSGESVLMDCVDAQYAACGLQDPEHPWDLVEPYCVVLSYASNSL